MDAAKPSVGLLLLVAFVGACTSNPPSAAPAPTPVDATGDWLLESGTIDEAAIPLVADYPITFSVDGTEAGGQSACNHYGGRLELADGRLQVIETSSTAMLCGPPGGEVMRSEAAFMLALGKVRAARAETDRLTLLGPGIELVFHRQPPIPIVEIVGRDWLLESVIHGEVVSAAIGEPATLRLDMDGTFRGSTGCRTFKGKWIEAAGRLVATQAEGTGECPGGLGGQDGIVIPASDGSTPTIAGDRLTLTKNGGIQLVYRRVTQ